MIKRILAVLLLVSGLQTSWAFSLAGPVRNGGDGWQVTEIGYGPPSDDVAPKNIGEEYRRNTPVMYYAFDANFFGYFGPEGATSIDAAYAMLNALTNVDQYSKQLSEFPLESRNQNFQAQALGLYDLKSFTLGIMMEQLGLADPVQYTWTLHDRFHVGNIPCPVGMEYLVAQRNFDYFTSPLNQLQYSPYVNATLYSYQIIEVCANAPVLALAAPFSVDPLADIYSPVSCAAILWGEYYTSLTRDDVAGLRYLLSTNNINWETPAADSLSIVTNKSFQELFPVSIITNSGVLFNGTFYGTASYGALLSFSKTNNLAAVQAAFPGVQATLVGNYFTNVIITNTISYFTNYYTEPAGTPPHLITKKVPTPTILEYFIYSFDNIITNIYSNKTISKLQIITVAPMNGAPIGSPLATNVVTKNVTTSIPSGEFYILPTNSPCGVDIFSTITTFTNYTTNILTTSVTTNATGTNTGNSYSQILVTPSISHVYQIHPVTCGVSNAITGLYRGIGNIKFVRADFDSLIGQYWQPVTNDYSMVLITNSKAVTQHFRRVVTTPDFLFSALDLTTGPPDPIHANFVFQSSVPGFDTANVLPGLAGPGTITPVTTVSFNKAGPIYFNSFGDVMDGTPFFNQTPGGDVNDAYFAEYFVWASFDGSTNAPIIYPNGTSLENLQNQILVQISPTSLPDGRVDIDYYDDQGVIFTATGGAFTQPFTWSSPNLPEGLILSPDGKLSGGATQTGTYDFIVRLTDHLGRSVEWAYTITINPT